MHVECALNKDTSVQYKRMSNLHLLHISANNVFISFIKCNYLDKRIQYKAKTVLMNKHCQCAAVSQVDVLRLQTVGQTLVGTTG